MEQAPRIDAVDGGREIALGGEGELPEENLGLFLDGRAAESGETRIVGLRAMDPAVQPNLADGGARVGVEVGEEVFLPGRRTVAGVPWVQAITRQHDGMSRSERRDIGPVGLAGAIGHDALHPDRGEIGEDARVMRHKFGILQVVMGIVESHAGGVAGAESMQLNFRRGVEASGDFHRRAVR